MKRIIKTSDRVYEAILNVRNKELRIYEYGTWYTSFGVLRLDNDAIKIFLDGDDNDILPIIESVYTLFDILPHRNPYFSSKTGKPLSKWFTI